MAFRDEKAGQRLSFNINRRAAALACVSLIGSSKLNANMALLGQARSKAVRLPDFRDTTDIDDADTLNRIISMGYRRIHLPRGGGSLGNGEYFGSGIILVDNLELFGDGMQQTVWNQAVAGQDNPHNMELNGVFFAESRGAQNQIENIWVHDLSVSGLSVLRGFSEHSHLFRLAGVAEVKLERIAFRNFQGDAVYLGSQAVKRRDGFYNNNVRHNKSVSISFCSFDSENYENRNGISIIDCDGFDISHNDFRDFCKSTMPGAIDLEPNPGDVKSVIRNGKISWNRFEGIGGGVGVIGAHIPSDCPMPRDIMINDNFFSDRKTIGFEFYFNPMRNTPLGVDYNVKMKNNRGRNGSGIYHIAGGTFHASGNRWTDYTEGSLIGGKFQFRSVSIADVFERCGARGGNGMFVNSGSGLRLASTFVDCGSGQPGAANAVNFHSGETKNIDLKGLSISSPNGKTLVAIQKEPGHKFEYISNRLHNAKLGGLPHFFAAPDV
jgi:hypothetical protein